MKSLRMTIMNKITTKVIQKMNPQPMTLRTLLQKLKRKLLISQTKSGITKEKANTRRTEETNILKTMMKSQETKEDREEETEKLPEKTIKETRSRRKKKRKTKEKISSPLANKSRKLLLILHHIRQLKLLNKFLQFLQPQNIYPRKDLVLLSYLQRQ